MSFGRTIWKSVHPYYPLAKQTIRKFSTNPPKFAEPSTSYESDIILKAPISTIRNIGIIAHIDAGKTTTTERLLYYSGLTNRIGNVDQGDTITDYMTQEKDRGITIQSAAVTIPWKSNKINVIDTPGHADFTFEVIRSLRVLDGAVTILDAVAGVEAQTEKVWKQAKDLDIPTIAYINKMDRDGAGFGRTVKEIVGRLGTRAILINTPYFEKDDTQNNVFKGIVDIINQKLIIWNESLITNGKEVEIFDLSDDPACKYPEIYDEMLKCREAVIETLGELDDSIIDNFFECDEDYTKVSSKLLNKVIREQTLAGEITPILCGSSFKNIGVQPLLDAIVDYLPSPIDTKPPKVIGGGLTSSLSKKKKNRKNNSNTTDTSNNNETKTTADVPSIIDPSLGCIVNNNKNLTTALAFKVINHPNRGLMIFVRVYSGKLQPNSTIINSRSGEKIKIGKLLIMNGDSTLDVKYLSAGNIGVITGTDEISTGDTLISHSINKNSNSITKTESNLKLLPIDIPPPVFSVAIEPSTVAGKRKLDSSLEILLKEDPSLKLSFDEESGQSILSGMGELHLEITKDRLVNDMNVNADIGDVTVTYKETILKEIDNVEMFENPNDIELPQFGISVSIYPFECEFEEMIESLHSTKTFNDDEDVHLLDINTAVIFDSNAKPANVLKELEKNIWNCDVSYEKIINSMLSGVTGSLQMGGRLARLPLQNIIIYINGWYVPELKDLNNVSELIKITRLAINKGLNQLMDKDFTLLEPIMNVRTFVLESDVGNVSQDLMSVRNAKILSIENENDLSNLENLQWNKNQMEKTYVPFDPTMQYLQNNNGVNKMVIISEAPLREMIGYLNKLRSLTKGRGIYDMELKGMERANGERVRQILDN